MHTHTAVKLDYWLHINTVSVMKMYKVKKLEIHLEKFKCLKKQKQITHRSRTHHAH